MVPTKRFWFVIALGIPLAALAAANGAVWIAVVYDVLALAAAWLTARLAPNAKNLYIERHFDPVLSVRVKNRVSVMVRNDGTEYIKAVFRDEPPPLFESSGKDFPISLKSGAETELYYSLIPYDRGSDFFRGSFLRVACPLGLVEQQFKLNT
jgi:uncharacterized protein (DUF58 family)